MSRSCVDLFDLVEEERAAGGGAGGSSAVCLRLPRENQELEVAGALDLDVDVDEVTEGFRDSPIIGILLLSFSFSLPFADLEP